LRIGVLIFFAKQKCGQLAVLTSVAGLRGGASIPDYNASRAYQISYLEALKLKSKRNGLNIIITDIRPGYIEGTHTDVPQPWTISLEKATTQIFNMIRKKKNIAYVSKRWRCMAILLRLKTIFNI